MTLALFQSRAVWYLEQVLSSGYM